ncbi:trypsin-like peptidase domain-containing protein [Amycolatopsis sp. NPDC004625]|uniref:trypsin-like peptidase domain-containing protein n=1 Tax=Amycolatopsis sp. NPDC004625 TaxID=3154670 RepID=UPI0033AE82C6
MTDFLDGYPLDWTDPRLRELRGVLGSAFYRPEEIEPLAVESGVPPTAVAWGQPAHRMWFDVLNEAAAQLVIRQLISLAVERRAALGRRIGELLGDAPVLGADLPADRPSTLAATDTRWRNFTGDNTERQIFADEETLLDISFLERGLRCSQAVCRLTVAHGSRLFHGTGFRIGVSTILTNHHVLFDADKESPATRVLAEFRYELGTDGTLLEPLAVECTPTSIKGESAHDFAVVSVSAPLPDDVPILSLTAIPPVTVGDRVSIVQHPHGLPKKLALHHNLVRHVDDDVIQYWTDTEAGSSGSPVFDRDWRVIALHHQWVRTNGEDGVAFRNQGRRASRVTERLVELGVDLAQA